VKKKRNREGSLCFSGI